MTTYWLRVRYYGTGLERTYTYGDLLGRALALIALAPYAAVLATGLGTALEATQ